MRNIFDSWQVRQENNCFAFMLFFGFQVSAGQFLITVVLLCVIEMASSAQSRLLSWSPDDDDDYEGGFNQDGADDDIDDDVCDDVDDGVKAHDVSYLLQPPCLWSREFPCQLLSSQGQ